MIGKSNSNRKMNMIVLFFLPSERIEVADPESQVNFLTCPN